MKLQEAYASENNKVGTWLEVGYKGPGSQNANGSASETSTFNYTDIDNGGWQAQAKVALNDCNNGKWIVDTDYDSGNVTTTAKSSSKATCVTPLIPNFCKIATSGDCAADATN